MLSSWVRLVVSSSVIFMAGLKRPERLKTPLLMTCRCWPGRSLHRNLLSGNRATIKLKAQYAHKLQDQYYAVMACSALQSSPEEESFTRFWGHSVMMFGGHARQSQSSASSAATSSSIETNASLIKEDERKLSKNSRQQQNKINMQEAQIKSLQTQNQQLQGLLDPKSLVNAISQAVTTSLKMELQQQIKAE